jgi:hypothetical protein
VYSRRALALRFGGRGGQKKRLRLWRRFFVVSRIFEVHECDVTAQNPKKDLFATMQKKLAPVNND